MRTLLLALLLCPLATAQIRFGEFGFSVQGPSGTAGDACWGFDCTTSRTLAIRTGDRLTFTVRAPLGAPYAVFASASATSCARVPGLYNALVIDAPIIPVFAGTISQRNGARFCYDGLETLGLAVPRLPTGAAVYFQAIAQIGTPPMPATGWAFASAVQLVVR